MRIKVQAEADMTDGWVRIDPEEYWADHIRIVADLGGTYLVSDGTVRRITAAYREGTNGLPPMPERYLVVRAVSRRTGEYVLAVYDGGRGAIVAEAVLASGLREPISRLPWMGLCTGGADAGTEDGGGSDEERPRPHKEGRPGHAFRGAVHRG